MKIIDKFLLSALILSATFSVAAAQGLSGVAAAPQFITTTITDGQFDPETNWYTIQIGAEGYYWTYTPSVQQMNLTKTTTKFNDADLWCFTGNNEDGYYIYNKVAGASMMLAASSGLDGSETSVSVMTQGIDGYCYKWQFRETDLLGADSQAFLVNEFGNVDKIVNNRDSRLAFLTTGADVNSAIKVIWAQRTIKMEGSTNGIYSQNKTSTWYSSWTHRGVEVGFRNSNCNMQPAADNSYLKIYSGASAATATPWNFFSPEGTYVCGYEFDFCKDGSYTAEVSVVNGENSLIAKYEKQHFQVADLSEDVSSDLSIVANPSTVNKGIQVTAMTITYRRAVKNKPGVVVFRYDGTKDYAICYRIPSITTIENGPHKGRILAVNDYRYSNADIGNGRIDLYMSYSDDNGLSWSTPDHMRNADGEPVAQGTGKGSIATSLQNPDCGFGDPAMVSDRETGRVMVVSVCGRTPFWSARRDNPNQVARWYSDDGGDTWTEFSNITESIYPLFDNTVPNGYIDSEFFGSGRMVQSRKVKVGDYYRVYAVMSGYHAESGVVSNWVLYTDDFGQTWNILGDPMTPPVASLGDEPKAEELPDGSVLLAGRRSSGNRNFNVFHYTDIAAGKGDWGTAVATDMGMGSINACNGEIMIIPVRNIATKRQSYMALQSFPYGGTRRNVSIAWKVLAEAADIANPMAFTKWNGRIQISNIGSCYSTMCWQHDNTLGFLYEEETYGKTYCEVYRNLSIEDITDGEYEYYPDEDGSVADALRAAVVDFRLQDEAPSEKEGKYVGQPDGKGNAKAENAAAAYRAEPTVDNYLLFNEAIASGAGYIEIIDGGVYTLKSAHAYGATFGDRWLTSDGVNLKSVSTPTAETVFTFVHRNDDSENWLIYHPATKSFIAQSPSVTETAFKVSVSVEDAHEYIASSTSAGLTSLSDSDPGNASYVSIHQGRNNNGHIVIWVPDEQASKWYMELDHMAAADEMPDLKSGMDQIMQDSTTDVRYFDIMGREILTPEHGQFLITSDRRKIIY